MPTQKIRLLKQKKSFLSNQNIRNVAANIELIRLICKPTKNLTNVIKKDTFLVSITATQL